MRSERIHWLTLLTKITPGALCVALAACGGSNSTSTAALPATTLPTATAALQKSLTTESPHVVSSSVVTGFNLFRHRSNHSRTAWDNLWSNLTAEAYAADLGLSVIWDPQNGSPPTGSDFAVPNLYNGGGFTCNGATNTCSNGSVTIAAQESLKNYMGQALNPDFQNSNGASVTLFGRLETATLVICAIGQLVPAASLDTDGLPVVGPLTLTFPTDTTSLLYQPRSSGGCGASTSDAGFSLNTTVTAVTSANYTKQFALSLGQTSLTIWLKLDSTAGTLNVMTVEDQRPSGRYAADRMIAHITGINTPGTGTVLFEYVSIGSNSGNPADTCFANGGWQCDFEMHRIFIDETADVAYLVSNTGSPGDLTGGTGAPTQYIQYTAAGTPSALKTCSTAGDTCTGNLALSIAADGQFEPNSSTIYPSAGTSYNACVNIVDRSIATDASLTCDLTGASILASGGASAMLELTREVYVGDVVATLLNHTSAATTLAFTGAADIYTAPDTQ